MKKVIAAFVLAAMLMSSAVYAVGGDTLASLNLATQSAFESDYMTKGEFISIVAKIMNLPTSSTSKNFADLKPNHEYYGAVSALAEIGLVNGDDKGYIHPDDPITYYQATKILVSALGYKDYAEVKGGYPLGYTAIASETRLGSGINAAGEDELSAADAETMLYNALDIAVMEAVSVGDKVTYEVTDDTLLSKYHDIYKAEGLVMGTHDIKLMDTLKIDKKQVQVGDYLYNRGDVDFDGMVGCNIDLYYRDEDGDYTAVAAVPRRGKNEVLTIASEDVKRVSGLTIEYVGENNKTQKANLTVDAYILYNNSPIERLDAKDFQGVDGKIRLIDSNGDGNYSVVFIESWRNVAVAEIDREKQLVYDKYSDYVLDLDDAKSGKTVVFLDEYGHRMETSELKEYDVLSVMESKDKTLVTVYYSNTEAEGTVTGIEEHEPISYVEIEGVQYPVTNEFLKKSGLTVGDYGLFVMNINGKIGAFRKFTGDTVRYGYLMNAAKNGGIGNRYECKILTSADKIEVYPCAQSVCMDAAEGKESRKKPAEVYKAFTDSDGAIVPQVIRYKLNGNGEITFIDTADTTEDEDDEHLDNFYSNTDIIYVNRVNMFGSKVPITSSTIAFCVPAAGMEDDEQYFRAYRAAEYFSNGDKYSIKAYKSQSDRHFADAILYNVDYSEASVSAAAPVFVVDKISQAVNSDGDKNYKITGYESGVYKELTTKGTDAVDKMKDNHKLKTGDVIQYSKYQNNEVISIKLMYDIENDILMTNNNPSSTDSNAKYRFLKGSVYSIDEGNVMIATGELAEKMTLSQLESYNAGIYPVCIYNAEEKDKVYMGSLADIQSYKVTGEGSKIFVASYYSGPGMIYVIKKTK